MILVLNTTTKQFSLGLLTDTGVLISEHVIMPLKTGSAFFMPSLDFLLRHSCSSIKEISCVVVAIGPGSFTGLKVALSVAKGICFSMNIPIIGVSSLEALAMQVPYSDVPITAIIDSRKREFFFAEFEFKDEKLVRKSADSYIRIEEFPERFQKRLFIGNDYNTQAPLIKEYMGKDALLAPSQLWYISAAHVGRLGIERLKKGDVDNILSLEPIYLRPPEIRKNPYGLRS